MEITEEAAHGPTDGQFECRSAAKMNLKKSQNPLVHVNDILTTGLLENTIHRSIPSYTVHHINISRNLNFKALSNLIDDGDNNMCQKVFMVEIELPLINSSSQLHLDIFDKSLFLQSTDSPKYHMDIDLPYAINEEEICARFDKRKHTLMITLPSKQFDNIHTVTNTTLRIIADGQCSGNKDSENKYISNIMHSRPNGCQSHETNKLGDISQSRDLLTILPDFNHHQCKEFVTFVFKVGRVNLSFVKLTFLNSHNGCHIEMPPDDWNDMKYSLLIRFPVHCKLDTGKYTILCEEYCIILVLLKATTAGGQWEKFEVGLEEGHLQEKIMLNESHMMMQMDEIKSQDGSHTVLRNGLHTVVDVTEMDREKLVVTVKDQSGFKRKKQLSESADEIQVVYQKQAPILKGIIKQRSRTTSESSDDVHLCSSVQHGRTNSFNGSDSPLTESDENTDGQLGQCRKIVSFSERVDKTTFKATQSVNSMKSTLKNKRKKQRKTDRRQAGMTGPHKQRKNSGSASSDDGSSSETGGSKMDHYAPITLQASKHRLEAFQQNANKACKEAASTEYPLNRLIDANMEYCKGSCLAMQNSCISKADCGHRNITDELPSCRLEVNGCPDLIPSEVNQSGNDERQLKINNQEHAHIFQPGDSSENDISSYKIIKDPKLFFKCQIAFSNIVMFDLDDDVF